MNQVITRKEEAKSQKPARTVCSHCGWETGPNASSLESNEGSGKAKYRIIM